MCVMIHNEMTLNTMDDFSCSPSALVVRWARDVYEFTESEVAAVELVTDSIFEVSRISIQGVPRRIPFGFRNYFPTLVVPGPAFSGK